MTLSVVDTGPPLPDAELALLRTRIDPAASGSEVRTGSRGLGLHIVAEIAVALQARIHLDRAKGDRGLAWTVTLPTSRVGPVNTP